MTSFTSATRRIPLLDRPGAIDVAFWLIGITLVTSGFFHPRQIDAALIILLVAFVSRVRRTLRVLTPTEKTFLVLLGLFAVWSVLPAEGIPEGQLVGGLQFVRAMGIYILLRTLISSIEVLWRFVRVGTWCALIALAFSLGDNALAQITGHTPITVTNDRLTGPAANANYFAHWLAILFGLNAGRLLWPLMVPHASRAATLSQVAILFVLATGCLFSQSRGSWVALAAVLLVSAIRLAGPVFRGGKTRVGQVKIFGLLVILGLGLLLFVELTPELRERAVSAIEGEGGVRLRFWGLALAWYVDASIIQQMFGVGAWQIHRYLPDVGVDSLHNGYLGMLVSYGAVGATIFIAVTWRIAREVARANPSVRYTLLGLVAALGFAGTNDTLVVPHFWVLMSLLLIGASLGCAVRSAHLEASVAR